MYFECILYCYWYFIDLKMCFIISCICVYYYDYLYVFYMLDIGERTIELMLSVYCHTDDNKDYLSIYKSTSALAST